MKTKTQLPPVSPRLEEAFHTVQKAMFAIFGLSRDHRNKRKLIPHVSVELVRESDTDAIVVDGWIYIMEQDHVETVKVIGGERTLTNPGWYLSYQTYDPGVRYHKDGSGTPPSTDVADCDPATVRRIFQAVDIVAGMVYKNMMNNICEEASFAELAKDEETSGL